MSTKLSRVLGAVALGIFIAHASGLPLARPAQAQDAEAAKKILKSMTDYIAGQKSFSATFDTSIEIMTPDLQKIQFNSSGQMQMARPDKLRASRVGGYSDVDLIFDGKTVTVAAKHLKVYAQLDAAGSVDQLIAKLRSEYAIEAPGADLLLSAAYDQLMNDVLDAKHIGLGVIGGNECEHIAFRNEETDWQLWVRTGPNPIPCKYVITSKAVTGGPEYTLVIKEWKADAAALPDTFAFKAAEGMKKVEPRALVDIDEVPAGVAKGDK